MKKLIRSRSQFGFLYVIEAPSVGMIKIGISTGDTIESRFANIQACSPVALILAFRFEVANGDARRIERHAHALLRAKRKHGEWFAATVDEGVSAIQIAYQNRLC